jgi:hypothetical protein
MENTFYLWRTHSTENTFHGLAPPIEHLLPIHVDALVTQGLAISSEGHVPRRLEILIIQLPVKFQDELLLLLLLVDSLVCVERLHHLLALELAQLRLLLKKIKGKKENVTMSACTIHTHTHTHTHMTYISYTHTHTHTGPVRAHAPGS